MSSFCLYNICTYTSVLHAYILFPIFSLFNDNSDFPSVHCHIKHKLRQFVYVLLPFLYLHLTWKSIIKSCTNWIIRLTLTAYFSSISILSLPLKAVELKKIHTFILYEHVSFLSSQCVINLFQRVKPEQIHFYLWASLQ